MAPAYAERASIIKNLDEILDETFWTTYLSCWCIGLSI